MNGEIKKQFAVALASLAVGAVLATVLGSPEARAKLVERSKQLFQRVQ